MLRGIDISKHQGTIDFNQVKVDGIQVVIIKATEGVDFRDDYVDQHYNGARGAGIAHIGFYHFMSERTDPRQQARDFYDAIRDKSYDVKPCLDIETNNQGRSAGQITDRCLAFIDEFKNISGQEVIIYTGGYFGRDNLDSRIKCFGGWIAHYGVNTPLETGFRVIGHQYTDKGSISGIAGNVDLNNFTEDILINNIGNPTILSASIGSIGVVTASILNVRDNPNGNIIGTLNNGEQVKIDKEVDGWYSIYFGDHGGYVSKDYINILEGVEGVYATVIASELNVRDSIMGNIVGQLKQGDQVKLCRQEGNWYHIYYGDNGAWVCADYLKI